MGFGAVIIMWGNREGGYLLQCQFKHYESQTNLLRIQPQAELWGACSSSPEPWHFLEFLNVIHMNDRLCGLVVRVSGYRSRGPGFDFRQHQIFWEVGGLERGPLSLVRTIEELLEWKKQRLRSRKPRLTAVGIRCTDHVTPSLPTKAGTNFAYKRRSLGRYSSLADYGHGVQVLFYSREYLFRAVRLFLVQ
jgi:hypothetical protein